jgi:hypothetical protein
MSLGAKVSGANDAVHDYRTVQRQQHATHPQTEGRMISDGLKYVDSRVESNFSRCFQLMECDDLRLLLEWILNWRGAEMSFEIIPVLTSKETQELVAPFPEEAKALDSVQSRAR